MEDRLIISPSGAAPKCTSFVYASEASDKVAVSIIVPVYNVEEYLEECLNSILAQTFQDFEVICINDGSTDDSLDILQSFAQRDKRIRIINQQNMGLAGARNHGLSVARGTYLCLVDSDDALDPNALKLLAQKAESHESDIVVFGFETIPSSKNTSSSEWPLCANPVRDIVYNSFSAEALFKEPGSKPFIWRYFIRRNLLTENDLWFWEDLPFGEDTLFQFTILPFAANITFCKERLYRYRTSRENSLMADSSAALAYKTRMHIRIVGLIIQTWKELGILPSLQNELVPWCINFVFFQFEKLDEETRSHVAPEFQEMLLSHIDLTCIPLGSEHLQRLCLITSYSLSDQGNGVPAWLISAAFAERFKNIPQKALAAFKNMQPDQTIKREVRTVAAFYHRLAGGGAEKVMCHLATLWKQFGYQVILISEEEPSTLEGTLKDLPVFTLPRFSTNRPAWYVERAQKLSEILTSHNVDVLVDHAWNSAGLAWDMLTTKVCDTAFIVYCHNLFCLREINAEAYFSQQPYVFSHADAIICLSDVDKAFWSRFNGNVFSTINPLDRKLFNAPQAPLDNANLIWIGRFSPEKRPEDAVRILASVRQFGIDAHLIMLGTGKSPEDMGAVQNLAEQLGVRQAVDFCGLQKDVSSFLSESSVALVTSEYEGFHLALFESLAHGVPAVVYELPNLTWLRDTAGVTIVPNGEIEEAARAVIDLLENPTALHAAGIAAKEHTEAFREFNQETAWTDIFASLGHPRPSAGLSTNEQDMWETLLGSYALGLNKLTLRHEQETQQLQEAAINQLSAITNSLSFRLGRALTFLPRKLRNLIHR